MEYLSSHFRDYFPVPDTSRNWIRNPFEIDISEINRLATSEEDNSIEISTNNNLKIKFDQTPIIDYPFKVIIQDYQI